MKTVLSIIFAVFLLFASSSHLFADDFFEERISLGNGTTLVIVWSSDRGHVVHEYIEVD
jgi:hypothetical protein